MQTTRHQRRLLRKSNKNWPVKLVEVPREHWPNALEGLKAVFRSRDFHAQVHEAKPPAIARLSVCRTDVRGDRWVDGITWEDLQRLKREAGFGDYDAVEVFPADIDVVNVANMRHLWILEEPFELSWRRYQE